MSKFNLVYEDVVNDAVESFERVFPETSLQLCEYVMRCISDAAHSGNFHTTIPISEYDEHECAYLGVVISNAGFYKKYCKLDDGTKAIRVFWMDI